MWGAIILIYVILFIAVFAYRWWDGRHRLSIDKQAYFSDIITTFYEYPSAEDMNEIWNARTALKTTIGRSIKFWLWGVSIKHPKFFTAEQTAEVQSYSRDIERGLRRVLTRPTTELIDCIWALYFATGDGQYSEIVKRIADFCPDGTISAAAQWSYESVTGQKLWTETAADNNARQDAVRPEPDTEMAVPSELTVPDQVEQNDTAEPTSEPLDILVV